jgi:exopolysaccharide production protein ExoY
MMPDRVRLMLFSVCVPMTYQPPRQKITRPSTAPVELALPAASGRARAVLQDRGRTTAYRGWGKRVFDLVLVAVLILPVAVLCGVLAVLIAMDGAGPFFGHRRVGRNGREFTCWKLRTMVPDAEARLAAHLAADPQASVEWAASQKLVTDPRITRIGLLLRKSSLDELPQVWNVLRGEMSLVGPRPVTEEELLRYGPDRGAYLSVVPGITGLWQVSGRNASSYERRVALDTEYAAGLTFWGDVVVLLKTVPAVLKLTGR